MPRPRSEHARQKMLAAAAELALEHGVRGVNIDAVAKRSGVAKTTIYRHFESKNELVIAALDGRTPVPTIPDCGSLKADLVAMYEEVLPIFASAEIRALFLDVLAVAARDPELRELKNQLLGSRMVLLETVVARAQERNEMPTGLDFGMIVDVIEGPLILRSIRDPESLNSLDLDHLADLAIARLHA